jgi:hypothetical protein
VLVSFGTAIEDVLNSYVEYLRSASPANVNRFEGTRAKDRESALAEAIVFSMLQAKGLRPEIHDKVGTGGPDFLCCGTGRIFRPRPEDEFLVEATCLNQDAVSTRSNLPKQPSQRIGGGAFGMLTQNICNKAKDKDRQANNCGMPVVLAIVSSHFGAGLVMDSTAAELVFASEPYFRVPLERPADPANYTDLNNSVFIKPGPHGTIIPCRQNLSAILLIGVYGSHSEVFGILHPEPCYSLNIKFFPDVPFVRLAQWPIVDGKIIPEWVVAYPTGHRVVHSAVHLSGGKPNSASAPR